jgi:NAD(P)-dependent dehydrogenase (short-subunit alcohol dehydrogenase family)
MNLNLQGLVGWVTGATGAIGQAICLGMAEEGVQVAMSARDLGRLEALADAIAEATGHRPAAVRADLTDPASIAGAVESILKAHGRIDLLVNSTTAPVAGPFEKLTDAEWEAVWQTKYLGYVRTLRAVLPHMQRQSYGRVVNISGGGGRQPSPMHLAGGGANAAVNHLSKGLANAYGQHGIRINVVAPGPIESERLQMMATTASVNPSSGVTPGQITSSPLGRTGQPEEVADAVLYLLSDRSGYVTGVVLPVDGGRLPTV